jgi:type IV pilus assembly protein PilW
VVGSTASATDTSDVLIVMSSSAGYDQLGITSVAAPKTADLYLQTSLTIQPSDLLLISDVQASSGMAPCLVEQVASTGYTPTTAAGVVPLAGTYYSATASDQGLASYSSLSTAMDLGNITSSPINSPSFYMLGVGSEESSSTTAPTSSAASSLYRYDILQLSGTVPVPFVDNVFEIHALYGIDTGGKGTVTAWQDPGTSPWDAATLSNGSASSNANLSKILAVRVALVLRTSLPEQKTVQASTTPFSIFSDLGSSYTVTCNVCVAETNYRWRVFDTIIPLHNPIYLGQ